MLFLFSLSYLPAPYLLSLSYISSSPTFLTVPYLFSLFPILSPCPYILSPCPYILSPCPYILPPCPISIRYLISMAPLLSPCPISYLIVPYLISLSQRYHILSTFPLAFLPLPLWFKGKIRNQCTVNSEKIASGFATNNSRSGKLLKNKASILCT